MCVDLTAVDYLTFEGDRGLPPGVAPERFEVVAGFLSHARRSRIRVRVQVAESDAALPSITALYPGADALEREAFDMFGIDFTGHPDLSRILMPEDWVGHPLRKDYNSGRIPVQFKNPVSSPDVVKTP
jgi:NADH-quinone oxidoreductase subunit C